MPNGDNDFTELQFFCPHTDRPLNVDIKMDDRSLATAWNNLVYLQCPHCGMEHNFTIKDLCFDQVSRLVRRYVAIDAIHSSYGDGGFQRWSPRDTVMIDPAALNWPNTGHLAHEKRKSTELDRVP